jgi:hypothetical protein
MFDFKEWKIWFQALPWSKRWFMWLLLLRPIIDNFYYLKKISPALSPLYIVGVLSPFFVLYYTPKLPKNPKSSIDTIFNFVSVMVLMSCAFILLRDPSAKDNITFTFKLPVMVYLFYFLRRVVNSRHDMEMILQTFVYSVYFVAASLAYEVLFNPIQVKYSRGLERIQGNFADVTNYGFYANLSFLCITYFFASKASTVPIAKRGLWLGASLLFSVTCILKINHGASWAVFISLVGMFGFQNIRVNKAGGLLVVAAIAALIGVFFMDTLIETIRPLIATDLAVADGDQDSGRLLHGRVGRWEEMFGIFFDTPFYAQLFGIPLDFSEVNQRFCGTGSHNDFLRHFFMIGIVGFIAYFYFFFHVVTKALRMKPLQQHLVLGGMIFTGLYSVSTNPSIYPPIMYLIVPIICYAALPASRR